MKKKIRIIAVLIAVMAVIMPLQSAFAAENCVLYNGVKVYYGSNSQQQTQNRGITIIYNWFNNLKTNNSNYSQRRLPHLHLLPNLLLLHQLLLPSLHLHLHLHLLQVPPDRGSLPAIN